MAERAEAPKKERSARIAILGAGPAGLAMGYFLKRRGFKDVMIFEKLGRVGGLCKSVTDGYMAFDLGGTYITPAYHETLKIARTVRAERYRGKRYKIVKVVGDGAHKRLEDDEVWDYARRGLDPDAPPLGMLKLVRCVFRFWWERRKVRRFVDGPSFERIHERPDLCISFGDWLDGHGLKDMRRIFEIPVTMMGYGFLDEVAAPYVLKFMAPGTYWSKFLRGLPGIGVFWAWPQRFRDGFQRMWERVSWGLNVRVDVNVVRVRRGTARELPVELTIESTEGLSPHSQDRTRRVLCFDKLIVACPLTLEVLTEIFQEVGEGGERRLTLSQAERELFRCVAPHTYVQNTLHAVKFDPVTRKEEPFKLFAPVVPVLPFNEQTFGKPWVVVQVWGDQSRLLQFYTRIDPKGEQVKQTRAAIEAASRELLRLLGGVEAGATPGNQRLARWTTYDQWAYFSHVSAADMKDGFFQKLDALQGQQDTYYTGAAATFEMVESVVRHAKHIAEVVSDDLSATGFKRPRRQSFRPIVPPYAESERLSADLG